MCDVPVIPQKTQAKGWLTSVPTLTNSYLTNPDQQLLEHVCLEKAVTTTDQDCRLQTCRSLCVIHGLFRAKSCMSDTNSSTRYLLQNLKTFDLLIRLSCSKQDPGQCCMTRCRHEVAQKKGSGVARERARAREAERKRERERAVPIQFNNSTVRRSGLCQRRGQLPSK